MTHKLLLFIFGCAFLCSCSVDLPTAETIDGSMIAVSSQKISEHVVPDRTIEDSDPSSSVENPEDSGQVFIEQPGRSDVSQSVEPESSTISSPNNTPVLTKTTTPSNASSSNSTPVLTKTTNRSSSSGSSSSGSATTSGGSSSSTTSAKGTDPSESIELDDAIFIDKEPQISIHTLLGEWLPANTGHTNDKLVFKFSELGSIDDNELKLKIEHCSTEKSGDSNCKFIAEWKLILMSENQFEVINIFSEQARGVHGNIIQFNPGEKRTGILTQDNRENAIAFIMKEDIDEETGLQYLTDFLYLDLVLSDENVIPPYFIKRCETSNCDSGK